MSMPYLIWLVTSLIAFRPTWRWFITNKTLLSWTVNGGADLAMGLFVNCYLAALWPLLILAVVSSKIGKALSGGDYQTLAFRMAGKKAEKKYSYDELLKRNAELEKELLDKSANIDNG